MSKFSLEVLKKCVHPYISTDDPDVILGPVFGEDVALTKIPEGILVSHVDPIVGAVKGIGWLAVHVACNDIATSGAPPRWILLLVLVPGREDEALLQEIMQDAARAAREAGVAIIGGHSGYSANLARPLVAVTALGVHSGPTPVCTRGARVGDHVLITKGIALEGTAILATDFTGAAARLGIQAGELEEARALTCGVSIIPEALALAGHGATSMHDVTRGGLLETLLEMALLSQVGMQVDLERIPIPPIVRRFADAFRFDPLKMISSGTLAATVPEERVQEACAALQAAGIPHADIGRVVEGRGVILRAGGGTTRHQDIRCEEDELARMWELFQPDPG